MTLALSGNYYNHIITYNIQSEEKRKALEDEYFEKWVREVDSEARSSDITGMGIINKYFA